MSEMPGPSRSGAMRCSSVASISSVTDSNQAPKLDSYAVFNAHASCRIDKSVQVFARVDNIFDRRYSTYGTFFETDAVPNFANGGAEFADARSVSPAGPRAFYVGLKVRF
jgi:iron complex outermembrane receptor protein